MRRRIAGLYEASISNNVVPDGVFLVTVDTVSYRHDAQKPFLIVRLVVLAPPQFAGRRITGRLYCTLKAMWKLNWFLRDFGYDIELLGRDEIDEKAVMGLRGIVKVSRRTMNGQQYLNLDGFAPASNWDDFQLDLAG